MAILRPVRGRPEESRQPATPEEERVDRLVTEKPGAAVEPQVERGRLRATEFLGRLAISAIFILSGIQKLVGPEAAADYSMQHGLPRVVFLMFLVGLFELLGGIALLSRRSARVAAWALAIYLVPVTLIFHTNFGDPNQIAHFLKNLAIIGGLLLATVADRPAGAVRRLSAQLALLTCGVGLGLNCRHGKETSRQSGGSQVRDSREDYHQQHCGVFL